MFQASRILFGLSLVALTAPVVSLHADDTWTPRPRVIIEGMIEGRDPGSNMVFAFYQVRVQEHFPTIGINEKPVADYVDVTIQEKNRDGSIAQDDRGNEKPANKLRVSSVPTEGDDGVTIFKADERDVENSGEMIAANIELHRNLAGSIGGRWGAIKGNLSYRSGGWANLDGWSNREPEEIPSPPTAGPPPADHKSDTFLEGYVMAVGENNTQYGTFHFEMTEHFASLEPAVDEKPAYITIDIKEPLKPGQTSRKHSYLKVDPVPDMDSEGDITYEAVEDPDQNANGSLKSARIIYSRRRGGHRNRRPNKITGSLVFKDGLMVGATGDATREPAE
jgi:hypothetical protein